MSNYWNTLRHRKISRRTMLGASAKAGVGAAGLALVGCGDDDDDAAAIDTSAVDAAASDAAAAASAASDAAEAAGRAAEAAESASALAAEAASSDDAEQAAEAAQAAADAASDAAAAAAAAGDAGAAAVAQAAADAAEAAAQAAREAGAEDTAAGAAAAQAAADAAAAAAAAAQDASAAAAEAAELAAEAVAAVEEDDIEDMADEPAATGAPVYGGKIVSFAALDIDQGWNPHRATSGSDSLFHLTYLYDRVLGYTDDGSAKAELAESWETPDDVTYLFNFAPGRAVFQDGAPVDANAMQANMEFLQTDPEASLNSITNSGLANAASFEAVDDVTWRLVNSVPVGPTLASFFTPTQSSNLISPSSLETAHLHPAGAGPARLVEHVTGEYWLAEKWDGYWDNDNVFADQFEVRVILDGNNAWAQFLDGEISYKTPPDAMTADLAAELEADGFKVATGISQQWQQQWFQLNPAAEGKNMFRDPRLRWAIGLSVDRDVVNDLSEDGLGKPSVCNTSTESWAIREGANYYDPPDLAKAAQLRDAAGFGDDNPVTGDILSFNKPYQLRTAIPVFNQLREAGWEGLTFVEGSESAILERMFGPGDWVTSTNTWNSPFDPAATMNPTIELLLTGWFYGSPADGPGTGRASLAENPNDQVLQDIAETHEYTLAAARFGSQEDRIEPYDKAFASFGDGNAWSDPDIQGHRWTYHWIQQGAGAAAQSNLEGFRMRPVDGWACGLTGHGFKGLWWST